MNDSFCNLVKTSHFVFKSASTYVVIHSDSEHLSSLTLIIRALDLSPALLHFAQELGSICPNISLYLLLSTGSFSTTSAFPELNSTLNARITRCDPLLCDNLVYSVLAYEVSDYGGILLWNESLPLNQVLSVIRSPSPSFASAWFSVKPLHEIRQVITDSRFQTVFTSFNPIKTLQDFENGTRSSSNATNPSTITTNSNNSSSLSTSNTSMRSMRSIDSFNSSVSHPPNNTVAVVMNVFKRNYFDHVFSSLCSQSLTPSFIILVQNEAHLINLLSLIPPLCRYSNITFFHIWNTNWNPYSFFRHFVPIPTDIQYTVITDDDLFLQRNALEMGIKFVETYHCVATEHGGKITNNTEGFDTWEDIRSYSYSYSNNNNSSSSSSSISNNSLIRYADYASLPQFSRTSWRKKVMKTPPFYRRFGDILFASISLFQEANIPPCIPPNFTFCEESKDDDSFSTLKKNRGLYAEDYNRIASTWMRMGYIPLYQREHET